MAFRQQSGDYGIMSKHPRTEAHSEIQEAVGRRMAWVRELVEPNRSEAARMIGVDSSTLFKIESGDRAPSIFNVIEFANRFRVSPDFLLRGNLISETNQELALLLAARHPELVEQLQRKASDTGSVQTDGRPIPPTTPTHTGPLS